MSFHPPHSERHNVEAGQGDEGHDDDATEPHAEHDRFSFYTT
jgi:hypothetical protein